MSWSRNKSSLEETTVSVLKSANKPLSLTQIVESIKETQPDALTGKTPRNSLYSVIYRREKRRIENGHQSLFLIEKIDGELVLELNPNA